jgi:hypothetical protein
MSDNEGTSCSSSDMETSSGEFCSEDELSEASLGAQAVPTEAPTEVGGNESVRGAMSVTPDPDEKLGKMPYKMTKSEMLAAIGRVGLDLVQGETAQCMKERLNKWRKEQLVKLGKVTTTVVRTSHCTRTCMHRFILSLT